MNRNQRLLLIVGGAIAVVLTAALVAVYLLGGRAGQNAGVIARLQSGLSAVTGNAPPSVAETGDFAFRRLEIDVSKPQAEACLVFTRTLDASGRTHYEDYLSIDPAIRIAVINSRPDADSVSATASAAAMLSLGCAGSFER